MAIMRGRCDVVSRSASIISNSEILDIGVYISCAINSGDIKMVKLIAETVTRVPLSTMLLKAYSTRYLTVEMCQLLDSRGLTPSPITLYELSTQSLPVIKWLLDHGKLCTNNVLHICMQEALLGGPAVDFLHYLADTLHYFISASREILACNVSNLYVLNNLCESGAKFGAALMARYLRHFIDIDYTFTHQQRYDMVKIVLERNISVIVMKMLFDQYNGNAPRPQTRTSDRTLFDVNWRPDQGTGPGMLSIAVKQRRCDAVELLLERGAKTNVFGDHHRYPLHTACIIGDVDIVQALIKHGANVEVRDDDHDTPLEWAVELEHHDVARVLLNNGARCSEYDGSSLLIRAVRDAWPLDVLKMMVDNGADVNAHNVEGLTALYCACREWLHDIVKWLLDNGADPNVCAEIDEHHREIDDTPLLVSMGDYRIVKMMIEHGADVNRESLNGVMPLDMAIRIKNAAIVKLLLDNHAKSDDAYVLHYACTSSTPEIVQLLILHGADVDKRNNDGITPLYCAYLNSELRLSTMQVILSHGCDANAIVGDKTILYCGCHGGNADIVDLLCRHGADVNIGQPLYDACCNGWKLIVEILCNHGARVNGDDDHSIPLHVGCRHGDIDVVRVLCRHGANVNKLDADRLSAYDVVNSFVSTDDIKQLMVQHGYDKS